MQCATCDVDVYGGSGRLGQQVAVWTVLGDNACLCNVMLQNHFLCGLKATAGGAGRRSGACTVGLQLLVRGDVGAACCPTYVKSLKQQCYMCLRSNCKTKQFMNVVNSFIQLLPLPARIP